MVDGSYSEHYSVAKLIEKVGKASKTASSELLRAVVTLYVILQEPTVPTLTKAMIVAALGYFICPIDLTAFLYGHRVKGGNNGYRKTWTSFH